MDQLYWKDGKKYRVAGYSNVDIYPGVWMVWEEPGVKRHNNLLCRISDVPDYVDIQKLAQTVRLEETVANAYLDIHKGAGNMSPYDIAQKICGAIYDEIKVRKPGRK